MSWKRQFSLVWQDDFSPVDPIFGRPGGGWSPTDPDYGVGSGLHPGNALPGGGHVSGGPIYGGGHPGNKPPGRPIVPPHPGNRPPNGGAPPHPWTPGHWDIIDPGWGLPPLLGFIPVDPGFGIPETPPPTAGTPLPPTGQPPKPDQGLPPGTPPPGPVMGPPPTPTGGFVVGGGQWVPVDPDFGVPVCPGRPKPPIWAWIPNPPDLSKPVPPTEPPTATPK
jgi:hypothetical protein